MPSPFCVSYTPSQEKAIPGFFLAKEQTMRKKTIFLLILAKLSKIRIFKMILLKLEGKQNENKLKEREDQKNSHISTVVF